MANPFPFVAGEVLTAADMNGIGEATAYTPTWTNLTVGNATQTFRYIRVQNLIYVEGTITLGTTSSVGNLPQFTLPVTAKNATLMRGVCYAIDAGVAFYPLTATFASTTSTALYALNTAGTYASNSFASATIPFTWGNLDQIVVQISYEAA
jgi:hypothetical protein